MIRGNLQGNDLAAVPILTNFHSSLIGDFSFPLSKLLPVMSGIITVFRLTRMKKFFVLSRQRVTSRMFPFSNDQQGDKKRRCSLKNSISLTLSRTHISLICTGEQGHVGLVLLTYGVVMLRGDDFADCKDSRSDYTHQQVIHPASVCPVLFRRGIWLQTHMQVHIHDYILL